MKLLFQIYKNVLKIDPSKYLKQRLFHIERLRDTQVVASIYSLVNYFKMSFFVPTVQVWNKLPRDVVGIDSFSVFANSLDVIFQC